MDELRVLIDEYKNLYESFKSLYEKEKAGFFGNILAGAYFIGKD